MADGLQKGGGVQEFELASRLLLRRLSETNDQMAAAEPGTDDFLHAYRESRRLRGMYRQVRGTWQVPAEVWDELPRVGAGAPAFSGRPTRRDR